ncbi:RdRp [Anopheles totivirus]|uniref:RNA-directed RNA polymerase n=1 Tax=Anopheles totivirus TaxID=1903415 RepID=A0A1C9U5D6_9VIRU|nr:RdRp [Anopheles totivirus]
MYSDGKHVEDRNMVRARKVARVGDVNRYDEVFRAAGCCSAWVKPAEKGDHVDAHVFPRKAHVRVHRVGAAQVLEGFTSWRAVMRASEVRIESVPSGQGLDPDKKRQKTSSISCKWCLLREDTKVPNPLELCKGFATLRSLGRILSEQKIEKLESLGSKKQNTGKTENVESVNGKKQKTNADSLDLRDFFSVYSTSVKKHNYSRMSSLNNIALCKLGRVFFKDDHDTRPIDIYNARAVIHVDSDMCGICLPAEPQIGGYIITVCQRCLSVCDPSVSVEFDKWLEQFGLVRNFGYSILNSLRRCRDYNGLLPIGSTFSYPLSAYLRLLKEQGVCGNLVDAVTQSYKHILGCAPACAVDDAVRNYFNNLDKVSFVEGSGGSQVQHVISCFHGLSQMGAARGWNEWTVINNTKDWVSGKEEEPESVLFQDTLVGRWVSEWCIGLRSKMEQKQTFEVFTTDLMKWATSGGAPASDVVTSSGVERVRSKWAWGYSNMQDGRNLYETARGYPLVAKVALKEESKTRTIITTPMSSYLRQCYILYVLGNPRFLDSTIGSQEHVQRLGRRRYKDYVCVDASKFDHSVSKRFIVQFWNCLLRTIESSVGPCTITELIRDELLELEQLVVDVFGEMVPYQGGLLSGWKMTSFFGSMKSALLCEWLNVKMGKAMQYVVQGDDIIMLSDSYVDKDTVCRLCGQFGITTNPNKTTVSDVGEFLKYRYGPDRISAYPARSVRSLYFANPWLDPHVDVSLSTTLTKWYTLASRLSVSLNSSGVAREVIRMGVRDAMRWSGGRITGQQMRELLRTPTNAGGLGLLETVPRLTARSIRILQPPGYRDTYESQLLQTLGVLPRKHRMETRTMTRDITLDLVRATNMCHHRTEISRIDIEPTCNTFKTLLEMYLSKVDNVNVRLVYNSCVGSADAKVHDDRLYPRYLRRTRDFMQRIRHVMFPESVTVPDSLYADARYDSRYLKRVVAATSAIILSARTMTKAKMCGLAIVVAVKYTKTNFIYHSK